MHYNSFLSAATMEPYIVTIEINNDHAIIIFILYYLLLLLMHIVNHYKRNILYSTNFWWTKLWWTISNPPMFYLPNVVNSNSELLSV